jgi:hypothetical protein
MQTILRYDHIIGQLRLHLSIIPGTDAALCKAVVAAWCPGSHYTKFKAAGWMFWFLHPFLWSHVSGLLIFLDGSDSEYASNFMQVSKKVQQRPWPWLDECLVEKILAIHWCLNGKVQTHRDRKKTRQVKSRVKTMHIISFDIKGVANK